MTNKENWNKFVSANNGSFLQSFEWGRFQEKADHKVYFLGNHQFQSLIIKHNLLLRQNYLYIPRGPLLHQDYEGQAFINFLKEIKAFAQKEKSIFVRIDPPVVVGSVPTTLTFGEFKNIGRSVQPRKNLIIDLKQSEEALLAAMHEKTRYNIHLAQRHKVTIRQSNRETMKRDSALFWDLISKTTERKNIRSYDKKYYETMLDTFCIQHRGGTVPPRHDIARGKLYFAYFGDKPLAAIFVVYFGTRATYLHGGTSLEHKKVMGPYLLHWEVMRQAKADGFTQYDFGGIDEIRWPGITRFKKGFGGEIEEYVNAHDFSSSRIKYKLYKIAKLVL